MTRQTSALPAVGSDLVYGALAGAVGAACMTPIRIAARRAGIIDKTVPQIMEETLAHRLGVGTWTSPEQHHVADHLLHLAYGSAQGAAYALATRRFRRSTVRPGLVFGVLSWLFGGAVVVPLLDASRPIWRSPPRAELVNLAAHLIYGAVTALLADDLARQPHHRPTSNTRRWFTSVG
jgi:uncharacterized membrane protein YagU involved in acid resistance